ncbi:hypothetical protein A5707_11210 [Mycobacterium kyorinense]|uniref:WXG100 family type VII secretion target n=1 Tax=Mycobacterium kyorinense TaxID=487514 RepID=A0A1A2ZVF5_9MYCO|nr:WXG100 family type VII secretion target [Mycobacterium kyorinense]OBI53678.1 hypothetical protein A5707_11210 [Mycobacterium kyorinense]
MVNIPDVEASNPDRLTQAAGQVGASVAAVREHLSAGRQALTQLRDGWEGAASEAAAARVERTLAQHQQLADTLQRFRSVLQSGGDQLAVTRASTLRILEQLQQQGWQVAPHGTVTVRPGSPLQRLFESSPVSAMQLRQLAATNSVALAKLLAEYDTQDRRLADDLRSAIKGLPGQVTDAPGSLGGAGPTIHGPATVHTPAEQKHDDLGVTIPGTGIRLGGDGVTADGRPGFPHVHIPRIHDGDNPLPVGRDANGNPLERPIPTGTARGPNGELYAFFTLVPYQSSGGTTDLDSPVPQRVVVDLAHPDQRLFTLEGVCRASGVFDPQSGRMIVVGNTPEGNRAMWRSEPVGKSHDWGALLPRQPYKIFSGAMNGNRESQVVALPNDGGYLLVGATDNGPVEGVVARTPEGLFDAAPEQLVGPIQDSASTWGSPYGPTITEFIDDENGQWVVHMRVSICTNPKGMPYNPETYDTTFTVTP